MRTLLGWLLVVVGCAVVGLAIYNAVVELGALYDQVAADPMAEPEIAEKDRPNRMIGHLLGGAWGLIPLLFGTWMVIAARRRRIRRRRGLLTPR